MRWATKNEQYVAPKIKYTNKVNCRGLFSTKEKMVLYFLDINLDTNLYIEILEFILSKMNKIIENSVIL